MFAGKSFSTSKRILLDDCVDAIFDCLKLWENSIFSRRLSDFFFGFFENLPYSWGFGVHSDHFLVGALRVEPLYSRHFFIDIAAVQWIELAGIGLKLSEIGEFVILSLSVGDFEDDDAASLIAQGQILAI